MTVAVLVCCISEANRRSHLPPPPVPALRSEDPRAKTRRKDGLIPDYKTPAALEPTLFPKLRVHFADFPYLHFSYRAEAVHLGDLMRLWVRYDVDFFHTRPLRRGTSASKRLFKVRRWRTGRRKTPRRYARPCVLLPTSGFHTASQA